MQSNQTTSCDSCKTLKCTIPFIDAKLVQLITNKLNQERYMANTYFNDALYSILLRYKRIISHRIYNPKYPTVKYDSQDLITKVKLYINK